MQFSRDDQPSFAVTRYTADTVTITGNAHHGSLAVGTDGLLTDWQCASVDALGDDELSPLIAEQPEVILLAVGDRVQFPDAGVMRRVLQAGIGLEVMNDGAAVRTFNIMLTEGRRVVLAFIRPST